MKPFRPSTWFGEQLLQEWGRWCIQYLEAFGSGGGCESDGGERRMTRAPGDHSDPVLAELIRTEIAGGISQSIHLRIADSEALDRRVAMIRYVGRPMKLPEFGGETVVWRGGIKIGSGPEVPFELPEPALLRTVCVPVEPSAVAIGRELGVEPAEVREATRRLRALAVRVYRRLNENKRRKAA